MNDTFFNNLLIILFLCIGIYAIYNTYKKPDFLYSQDVKGYVAGILFIMMALFSFFGKFSILKILKDLFTK
jgi:hypothetical protein